jgi:hypothetical protein
MHARRQQLRGVVMPQIVKANTRKIPYAANKVRELVRQTMGLMWLTVGSCAHKRIAILLPNPKASNSSAC